MEVYLYIAIPESNNTDYIRIDFSQVRYMSFIREESLLKAFEYYMYSRWHIDIYNIKIVDIQVKIKDRYYNMPTFDKPITNYDIILDDCDELYSILNHPKMTIPYAYINICLHLKEVLSVHEFDMYNGGERLTTEEYKEYYLEHNYVPDELLPYIDWKGLADEYYHHVELTEPDLYDDKEYVIDR